MTNIQWTDVTDNPIVGENGGWWCKKISPGCANCYAEKLNQNSFFGGNDLPYTGHVPFLKLRKELITSWAKAKKPKKHFVSSMTDVFGEWVLLEWQIQILDGMLAAPKQTFQVLTKRPGVMAIAIGQWLRINKLDRLPENIWVGTSVEDQKMTDLRAPQLITIPAKIHFLSVEPLLEKVKLNLDNLQWVIVGGESGVDARPCRVEWLISVAKQCQEAGVPVFIKQLGSKPYGGCEEYFPGINTFRCRDKKGGDIAEFPDELRVRDFPCN